MTKKWSSTASLDGQTKRQSSKRARRVFVLDAEDFDEVVHDLENPSPPTETIKRGAELLRKLYGAQR